MPRPELYTVKKVVGFDEPMMSAIDQWRSKQKPIPNVSEAIRRLIELGLANASPSRPPSRKAAAKSSELAGEQIDRLQQDKAGTAQELESRKRRLLKGPSEFRDMRAPKAKR
jgi:hypothetical protein